MAFSRSWRNNHSPFVGIMILLAAASCSMFYALLWKAGNLADLPSSRIGFYNFCSWKEDMGSLACYNFPESDVSGIPQVGLASARLGVYGASVLTVFVPSPLLLAQYNRDEGEWRSAVCFSAASSISLAGGLSLFLSFVWKWLRLSFSGPALPALCLAQSLFIFLLVATVRFPPRDKEDKNQWENC